MIRVAVVGAGHWGPNLIRVIDAHPRTDLRWVADRDPDRVRQVSERYPDVRTTTDATETWESDDVDAVVITTPVRTHHELAAAALAAGKDVFVEKPMTPDIETSRDLCRLAVVGGRVLMVGHTFLYNAGVKRVKAAIDAGEVGRILYISATRTSLGPIRLDVNAGWDLASHDIAIANFWLGRTPSTVTATAGAWVNESVADAVFATLRYPGGTMLNIHASWLHPRKAREISVVGETRMLTFDDMSLTEPVRMYDKGVSDERRPAPFIDSFASFRSSVREGDIVVPKVFGREPLAEEIDHFVDCVEQRSTPLTDGRLGLEIVAALSALQRSIDAGGAEQEIEQVDLTPTA